MEKGFVYLRRYVERYKRMPRIGYYKGSGELSVSESHSRRADGRKGHWEPVFYFSTDGCPSRKYQIRNSQSSPQNLP